MRGCSWHRLCHSIIMDREYTTWWCIGGCFSLNLGSTNIFCKGSDRKYFVYHSVSVTSTQLCSYRTKADIDSPQMNERSCIPIKLYLRKLKLNFIEFLMSQSTLLLIFSPPFKDENPFLSLWVLAKKPVVRIRGSYWGRCRPLGSI